MANMMLSPEQWKHLTLLHIGSLYEQLKALPSTTETGASNLTDVHLRLIDGSLAYLRNGRDGLLDAWCRSRIDMPLPAPPPAPVEQPQPQSAPPARNGAAPKAKGKVGWPLGKKRGPRKQAAGAMQ